MVCHKQLSYFIVQDYLTKPFDKEELLLRIKALLRRARIVDERRINMGNVTLDHDSHTVRCGDEIQTVRGIGYRAVRKDGST